MFQKQRFLDYFWNILLILVGVLPILTNNLYHLFVSFAQTVKRIGVRGIAESYGKIEILRRKAGVRRVYPPGGEDEYFGQQHPALFYLYVVFNAGVARHYLPHHGVLAGNEQAPPPTRPPHNLGTVILLVDTGRSSATTD